MRTAVVVALAVVVPGAAWAQAPGATPPAPVYQPPAPAVRSGFTIGGGLAIGELGYPGCDDCEKTEAGGIFFHAGWLVAPRIALMIDVWAMGHHERQWGSESYSVVSLAARWWATPRLWLGAGIGGASYAVEACEFDLCTERRPEEAGDGGFVALGYELSHSRTFAIDAQLRLGGVEFDDGVERNMGALLFGLNWY